MTKTPRRRKNKKYRAFWLFVKIQLALLLLVAGAGLYYTFGGYGEEVRALKREAGAAVRASDKETFRDNQTGIVYAADGSVISTLKGGRESYYLTREEIPEQAAAAIISIEDKKFYRHDGVDYRAIVRAVLAMLVNGRVTQGGSTITMQLARNCFLTQEKTWQRKVEEIFIAWDLEKKYTKDEILEFYLNNIYFGNGYYGILSASRGYFDRETAELSLSQTAFLCAIPNNPTLYDPLVNMEHTLERRDRILLNMKEDGMISERAYKEAVAEQIWLQRPQGHEKNDYVETYAYYCATRALMEEAGFVFETEFATREAEAAYREAYEELYGSCQKDLYTKGYRIYTSLDLGMQERLQAAVSDTLGGYEEVNEEGIYALQASAVCIDNQSGYVKSIVGGRLQEYNGYTLNRAYQSYRQPGSAIKPLIVYAPAFERGYTPDSIVTDEEIPDGPKNANGRYQGEMTFREAAENSVNTVAWRLFEEISPARGLSYLAEMNFSKLDAEDYRQTSALGGFTNGVSALEMAAGYAALENDGVYRRPTCIVKIEDADGNLICRPNQTEKTVYRKNAARMTTDVLTGVFTRGTARGLGLSQMPCAGKTGTTNDQKDGWFAGYTRYYTTSVWVGYDMPRGMDALMGNTYPGKIWQTYMEQIHEGLEPLAFLPAAQLSEEYQEKQREAAEAAERERQEGKAPPKEAQPSGEPEAGGEPQPSGEPEAAETPAGDGGTD